MTNKSRLNWPTSLHEPDLEHSTDNNSSLDPGDNFRLACRNISDFFPQKSFSGLLLPRRSDYTIRRRQRYW